MAAAKLRRMFMPSIPVHSGFSPQSSYQKRVPGKHSTAAPFPGEAEALRRVEFRAGAFTLVRVCVRFHSLASSIENSHASSAEPCTTIAYGDSHTP